MAERSVQTLKNILKKSAQSDVHLAILEWRNTPIDNNIGSPVQLLMGRRTKTQFQ